MAASSNSSGNSRRASDKKTKFQPDILDRIPPQNLEAERALLASMLIAPRYYDDIASILHRDDFYAESNRIIYTHLEQMHSETKNVDVTLLVDSLRTAGELENIGGEAYLAEMLHSQVVPVHAVSYAEIIRDKARLRNLIHASVDIIHEAYESTQPPQELVSQAEEKIFAIHEGRAGDSVSKLGDVLFQSYELIDDRLRNGGATGTPTGFVDLDKMLGGLHHDELIILAARPSMGKTALATNIADHVAVEEGVGTLMVSLEMAALELVQRIVAGRGRIDGRKFRSGFASEKDHKNFNKAYGALRDAPLYIDDSPSRSMSEISAVARRLKRQGNLGLIIIDYLQLISPDNSKDPRQEQVAKIARRLKGLARELSIPVLCLAQLNRQTEASGGSHIPRMSHLRESGAIEQDADVVMFVHREEYYMTEKEAEENGIKGKAQIIVSKQRNGPVGSVDLAWFSQYTRFMNLAEDSGHAEYKEYTDFEGADDGFDNAGSDFNGADSSSGDEDDGF